MAQGSRSDGVIKGTFIAVIIVGMIITASNVMIFEFQSVNPNFIDTDKFQSYNTSFSYYEQSQADIENLKDVFGNQKGLADKTQSFLTVASSLVSGQILNFASSFQFINDIFNVLYSTFGIPQWVGYGLFTLVLISIIFSIISIFFYKEL